MAETLFYIGASASMIGSLGAMITRKMEWATLIVIGLPVMFGASLWL